MDDDVKKVLGYLNKNKIRATYTAVQSYLGYGVMEKVDWGKVLGSRCPYASWVVSKRTGLPIGYKKKQLDPDLESKSRILTKGRQLQFALDAEDNIADQETSSNVKVADCLGNNCAVICPSCSKAYVVSGFLNSGVRSCPHCRGSKAIYKQIRQQWENTHQVPAIESEQTATRLTFKKEWLGYDVWVTFAEDGVTYRYPHDQLLQTFISRLGIIENTKSWKVDGIYHFPRLSAEQKKLLERYKVD